MNNRSMPPALFDAVLDMLPPSMRRALHNDKSFLGQLDISTVTIVTLGNNGPSFRCDALYDSIRSALRNQGNAITVNDESDTTWNVIVQPQGETLEFYIRSEGVSYSLIDHYSALADDVATRIEWFEKTAKEIYFEGTVYQNWHSRLQGKQLSDDEFSELLADIEQTPVSTFRSLQNSFGQGRVDLEMLVPHKRNFYEQLVGQLGPTITVAEYIETVAKPLIADIQRWSAPQGFLYVLPTCSAGLISECIQINDVSHEELLQAYQWLVASGDPVSRTGAVEIALSHLDTHPELAPFIEQIVEGFIADNPENDSSSFALLSAMIVMVASELARKRSLGDVPPFYRKQAAIAQASLAVRAINGSRIDPASVTQWAQNLGLGHIYFLQGLVDLRHEPRWLPDFVSAAQLRAEFIGRISNAALKNKAKIQTESLQTLLLGPDSGLAGAVPKPFPHLPGPLEGGAKPTHIIPESVLKEVTESLEADHLEASSFTLLANTALLFDLPSGQSSLAASALRRVKYSVEKVEDKDTTFGLISGLAIVAAVTRGSDLADALRILVRVLRRRKHLSVDLDDEFRIVMIAAASLESIEDWAQFAGEWITEIAFEVEDKNEARKLLANLRRIVQLEPALMPHCAAADAALAAFAY